MDFGILGPLEVRVGGKPVTMASPRLQVLLAVLLSQAGEPVSADRLIDALWGATPPTTATKGLHVLIHRLRGALGDPDRLVYQPPGYRIVVRPGELDAHRFEQLVAEANTYGDPGAAAVTLAKALALWRGAAFDGLIGVAAIHEHALGLAERHLAVTEQLLDLELDLGRHAQAIPDLMRLVAAHPLREGLRARLMLALYRSGRQAEALEVYRSGRQILITELGIEPGAELRRLEQAILNNDAVLTPSQPELRPCQLPPDVPDFTGRASHVATVGDLLGWAPDTGAVVVAAIAGPRGVGKTTLAVHIAHRLREEFPDGQLYVNLQPSEDRPTDPDEVLGRFLRGLGIEGSAIPAGADERAELYRAIVADRRLLLVLDNAADEAQVRPLLPGTASCGVLVTSRARLTGLPTSHLVDLEVFGRDDAVELLARVAGRDRVDADPVTSAEIAQLCGYLPLALRIAGARLAARPHWSLSRLVALLADERRRLDELVHGDLAVRAGVTLSYQALQPQARRLFRLLGLLDIVDFPAWMAWALLDVSPREELLDALLDARLIEAIGVDGADQVRYRFHDLLRVYARERASVEESPTSRTAALARLAGCLLHLAEDAHRRGHGGDHHILHGSAPRWRLPDALTDELLVNPVGWCEGELAALVAAVRQTAELGLDELCWDLAGTCITMFCARSYLDDWRYTHVIALECVRATGNRRGEAVTLFGQARLAMDTERYEDARQLTALATTLFEEVGDEDGQSLVLCLRPYLDCQRGDPKSGLGAGLRAATAQYARGDLCAAGFALCGAGIAHTLMDEAAEAERSFKESLVAYDLCGCRDGRIRTLYWLGELHLRRRRGHEAERVYRSLLSDARLQASPRAEANGLVGLGAALLVQSRTSEAAPHLDRAVRIAQKVGDRLAESQAQGFLDRPDPARQAVLSTYQPGSPMPLW